MENENDLGQAGEMLIKGEITEIEIQSFLAKETHEEEEESKPSQ